MVAVRGWVTGNGNGDGAMVTDMVREWLVAWAGTQSIASFKHGLRAGATCKTGGGACCHRLLCIRF